MTIKFVLIKCAIGHGFGNLNSRIGNHMGKTSMRENIIGTNGFTNFRKFNIKHTEIRKKQYLPLIRRITTVTTLLFRTIDMRITFCRSRLPTFYYVAHPNPMGSETYLGCRHAQPCMR